MPCAVLALFMGVFPAGCSSALATAVSGGAHSQGEASAPAFISLQSFETASLPLCECTGLQADELQGRACSLAPPMPAPDLCFVPRSYCAVVEPAETLAATIQSRHGPATQTVNGEATQLMLLWRDSAEWARIGQSAVLIEKSLPIALTPSCRCWEFGDVMVAPCDQQEAQLRHVSLPSAPCTEDIKQYGAARLGARSTDIAVPVSKEHLSQHVGMTEHHAGSHLLAGLADGLKQIPLMQHSNRATKQPLGGGMLRRLATDGPIKGSRISSTVAAAVPGDTVCHRSCGSCLEPGRDHCRSCINQLPYPYLPPKDRALQALPNGVGSASDIRGLPNEAVQYHALIAAHRDGSGYCIPLAFGQDAPEGRDSLCLGAGSPCTPAEDTSSWWTVAGIWNSGGGGHCHPTCSVCRADCCRQKPDNCLACQGPRRAFHPVYRDGTGRCVDPIQFDGEQQSGSWEWDDMTPVAPKPEDRSAATEGEANAFSTLLHFILRAASSAGSDADDSRKDSVPAKTGGARSGPSFLPHRSVCDSLPQRIRDMPVRAWSQLMFIHADNNLEESALLDLEEMLHPWRGEVVRRHARASSRGRGTPPLPVGGSALPGTAAHEALEELYLVVLIDRSHQSTSTDMGTVHACPQLEYSNIGPGARQLPGTSEVELNSQMAFELLRLHFQDGRREWLLLRALGEVRRQLTYTPASN